MGTKSHSCVIPTTFRSRRNEIQISVVDGNSDAIRNSKIDDGGGGGSCVVVIVL